MQTLGATLKLLRTAAKIKQKEMADQLNISAPYLSLIESSAREPSIALLKNYSAALGVPLRLLLWYIEEPKNVNHGKRKEFMEDFAPLRTLLSEFQEGLTQQKFKNKGRSKKKA